MVLSKMVMIDITNKPDVFREATAIGQIKLQSKTINLIQEGKIEKGDPIYAAKISGILAAKKTNTLLPLCHPIPLTNVEIKIILAQSMIQVTSKVKTKAQTGVEMEALTATAIALLTIWDMVKQYEKDSEGQYPSTIVKNIQITKKVKEEILNE
jgi:cyclic pyranopterin phosphate synthase